MAGHIKSAKQISDAVQEIYKRADLSERDLTKDETREVEELLLEVKSKKRLEDLGREFGGGFMSFMGDGSGQRFGASPGEAFTNSDGYKKVKNAGSRGQQWTTGLVNVGLQAKGTLLESAGGGGGALVPVPQVAGGVVDTLFRPLVLEDLLLSGQATGNSVRYITQGTATSGAAGVAEAGVKPESTLGFATIDEPVKKIATSLVISDETLEDAPAIQSFVNNQLSMYVRLEAERQILRGTSGGNGCRVS